jgi:hypothetical protein
VNAIMVVPIARHVEVQTREDRLADHHMMYVSVAAQALGDLSAGEIDVHVLVFIPPGRSASRLLTDSADSSLPG